MKTQNDGEREGEKNWLTMEKVPKERRGKKCGNVQELITRGNFRT